MIAESEVILGEMADWVHLKYSKTSIDRAGSVLIHGGASELQVMSAVDIMSNWRSSHSFPLNTFQNGLRNRSRRIDLQSIVSQRIKRLSSIRSKLLRFKTMKLSQMQDIGGCRAVMRSVAQVRKLTRDYQVSSLKHELVDLDDYIESPRRSGYRSVHLIYRYHSDRSATFNGLKIEVQLRSRLQHAWATAVETTGTFIQQALKSSQGEQEWLEFFSLMGTAIALRERTLPVPGTTTDATKLKRNLREFAQTLEVEHHLRGWGAALQSIEQGHLGQGAHFFLLSLDPEAKSVTVKGYPIHDVERASDEYLQEEQRDGIDAVLVSVDALTSLKRAYPNYFLDTGVFMGAVRRAIA